MKVLKSTKKKKTFKRRLRKVAKQGLGIFDKLIDKLPVELHLPGGYNYCGPGIFYKITLKEIIGNVVMLFCKKYRY